MCSLHRTCTHAHIALKGLLTTRGALSSPAARTFGSSAVSGVGGVCRCNALQAATFAIRQWPFFAEAFHFEGQGSTPAERTAHMQRQIALLPSSSDFLAPSSWPAGSCLVGLDATWNANPQRSVQTSSALQTTSLVSLKLTQEPGGTVSTLQGLSNLRGLTSLAIGSGRASPISSSSSSVLPVLASIASLTNLQTLDFGMSYTPDEGSSLIAFPAGWSQLTRLTCLRLASHFQNLHALTLLRSLRSVQLIAHPHPAPSLSALLPLTCLTQLRFLPASDVGQEAPLGAVVDAQGVVVSAAWKAGLRKMEWSCRDSFCIPVVAQLTGLENLELHDVEVTPELCRQGLSLLQMLHPSQPPLPLPFFLPSACLDACHAVLRSQHLLLRMLLGNAAHAGIQNSTDLWANLPMVMHPHEALFLYFSADACDRQMPTNLHIRDLYGTGSLLLLQLTDAGACVRMDIAAGRTVSGGESNTHGLCCCRVLGMLPRLTSAALNDATVLAEVPCPSIPRALLPTLPSLKPLRGGSCALELALGDGNLVPLHVLARWTNIPHPVRMLLEFGSDADCLAVKGWSVEWLISALACTCAAFTPVVLTDDADVDLLLQALGGAGASRLYMPPLWLGTAVSPAAFCRLLRCEHLHNNALTIGKPPAALPPYVVGWDGALTLTTNYCTELLGHGELSQLYQLSLADCSRLQDEAVTALASVARELRHVALFGAAMLGDASLSALAAGCGQLEDVVLSETTRITAGGLRLLLTVPRVMRRVKILELRMGVAGALHRDIGAFCATGSRGMIFDQWGIADAEDGLVCTKKQSPAQEGR
jgi:hypothetical protein